MFSSSQELKRLAERRKHIELEDLLLEAAGQSVGFGPVAKKLPLGQSGKKQVVAHELGAFGLVSQVVMLPDRNEGIG